MRAFPVCLLLAAAVSANEKWDRFYESEVKGEWDNAVKAAERVLIVRSFKDVDQPEAAQWLLERPVLGEHSAHVVREAILVLQSYKRPETIHAMVATFDKKFKKDWWRRAIALQAFATMRTETARAPIHKAFQDKKPGVVVSACVAAGIQKDTDLRNKVKAALKHKAWQVRAAALRSIYEMKFASDLPVVFPLFCADKSARVRYEAWRTIQKLAMEKLGADPAEWKAWYEDRIRSVPEGLENPWGRAMPKTKGPVPQPGWFFQIPVMGDRVVFCIDSSGDMDNAWRIDVETERKKKPPERTPDFFSVKTKWQLVRANLKRCLKAMPASTEIGFVFFSNKLQVRPEERTRFWKNTAKQRDSILAQMEEGIHVQGTTDMAAALGAAWGFFKSGDPDTNFAKGCDTIVFVTDGLPTAGAMTNKSEEIRDLAWQVGLPRSLRIHTVGLHNHAFRLMRWLAEDSAGLYQHAQQYDDTGEPQDLDFWPEKKRKFKLAQLKAMRDKKRRKKTGN